MTNSSDIWAVWPDGFMCPKEEIYMFNYRSDDYYYVEVYDYGEDGEPSNWSEIYKL